MGLYFLPQNFWVVLQIKQLIDWLQVQLLLFFKRVIYGVIISTGFNRMSFLIWVVKNLLLNQRQVFLFCLVDLAVLLLFAD
jgi:hypothetical protein